MKVRPSRHSLASPLLRAQAYRILKEPRPELGILATSVHISFAAGPEILLSDELQGAQVKLIFLLLFFFLSFLSFLF